MSEFTEYPLPSRWRWVSIEDIASYVQRGKSPKYVDGSGMVVVNQKCIRWDGVRAEHLKFIDPSQWHAWAPERTLRDGDILWNSTGTGTIGRAAIYRSLPGFSRVVADSHVTVIRLKDGAPEYVHGWISSPFIQARIEAMQTGSTNQVELGRGEVLTTRVPLPPLAEQRRIVAKLEAIQARSRRARERLDAVTPLLEKLRQSILAAAFRGDLTKDWRAKNPDVEPGTELLKRIRADRRKKWESTELAKLRAKGKAPFDDRWKAKYKQPEPVDATALPELPEGWCWASVDDVSDLQLGQQRAPIHAAAKETHPYVRTANITWDGLDLSDVKRMGFPDPERYRLRAGDVLLSEASGSPTEVGKPAIWRDEIPGCCYQKTLLRARPRSREVSSEWLYLCFLADALLGRFARMAPGVGILHLTADRMLSWPVALPPQEEQSQVIALATANLRTVTTLEDAVDRTSAQVASLERAVLAKAFHGELVPQDPTDEPATKVFGRLQDAKAGASTDEAPSQTTKHGGKRARSSLNGEAT